MFAYNQLSDLKDGSLVVPLRKNNDKIVCNKDGIEVEYSFDDFDFDKTIEERNFIVDDGTTAEEETVDEKIINNITEINNSIEINIDSHWITDNEKKQDILNSNNLKYKNIDKVDIWCESI